MFINRTSKWYIAKPIESIITIQFHNIIKSVIKKFNKIHSQ